MDAYEKFYLEFGWRIPDYFNFGDVVDQLAADPGRIALRWEDQDGNRARLTFADIRNQSNRIANVLTGLGIKRGDPVMLALPRLTLWQAAYVAALKVGALVIPCDATLREKDLIYRANHSQAVAIISAGDNAEMIVDLRTECPSLKHYLIAGSARSGWVSLRDAMNQATMAFAPVRTASNEPAICYYTSGTTSEPKAVLHTQSYIYVQRYIGSLWLDLKPDGLHWTTADTGWAKAAYGVIFGPWMNSASVFMYKGPPDPQKQLELLRRYNIETFCAPPTEYRMLLKENLEKHPLPSLRHCTAAGEPLNAEVIRAWHDRYNVTIHDGYGQTEAGIVAANLPIMEVKPGSIGRPFPGLDVQVVADNLSECYVDMVGEVAIRVVPKRPPSLMLGYWKNSTDNATAFVRDFYLTGDYAYRDSDGYLWFVGRVDDVINSAGYRIGPFEVESALLEHPAVMESAVVGCPDPDHGTIVKAFVKCKPGVERSFLLAHELQQFVKGVTAPYKYPREIEFVDDLPKTVSGKIRRVELRRLEERRKLGGS
jgi:acyl-coenzyme A synthetase/AMP-(fatty) acid ligase